MGYLVARVDVGPALRNTAVGLLHVSATFLVVSAVAICNRIYLIGGVLRRVGQLPVGVLAAAAGLGALALITRQPQASPRQRAEP